MLLILSFLFLVLSVAVVNGLANPEPPKKIIRETVILFLCISVSLIVLGVVVHLVSA